MISSENLFGHVRSRIPQELIDVLANNQHVRVERIISTGHVTPDGVWYDQNEHEWVAVLKGEARLRFDGDNDPIHLMPGDHVNIPAHRRHRVEWTSPKEPTIWLAVFYRD